MFLLVFTDLPTLATLTVSSPRSLLRMPGPREGFQLVLKLQLEPGVSGEGSLPQFTPLRPVHPSPDPQVHHLILVTALLISYWFSLSLGWPPSEVTLFSWSCLLGPYLLHSAPICCIQ